MRRLRWVFLGLFLALALSLFLLPQTRDSGWGTVHWLIVFLLFFASQALFIFGAGTWDLSRPVRKRHLWLPVTILAAMFAVLTAGVWLALSELFRLGDSAVWLFLFIGSWMIWGVLLWIYTYRIDRFRALHRMTSWLFLGSIAELLAAVPAHILVTRRRPGCLSFEGLRTGIGMMAGIAVMVWALGPAVVLLVLKNRYHRERNARRQRVNGAAIPRAPAQNEASQP
jgi:hypothetical protein